MKQEVVGVPGKRYPRPSQPFSLIPRTRMRVELCLDTEPGDAGGEVRACIFGVFLSELSRFVEAASSTECIGE